MRLGDLAEACEALRSNPITHLGLAHKELFHSNFLGWLAQAHPEAAATVFASYLTADPGCTEHEVHREWSNLDLVLRLPGQRPLIVENKTFSPPDAGQLHRYSATLERLGVVGNCVLLSLSPPDWPSQDPGLLQWQWMSYEELVAGLESAAERVTPDFDRQLVARYAHMVAQLAAVAQTYTSMSDDDPVVPGQDELALLRSARLGDGILKLRSRIIRRKLLETARLEDSAAPHLVEAGFTNGSPLLGARFLKNDIELGWQFQHGQFRLCAVFRQATVQGLEHRSTRSERAWELQESGTWFDFEPIDKLLGSRSRVPRRRPDSRGFNHYNPNFVYSYRAVEGLTVGEIVHLHTHYMRDADWPIRPDYGQP